MAVSSESLTLQEGADRLGVHYMTMYRYVRLGLIEATKTGGTWVVGSDAIEKFRSEPVRDPGKSQAPWAKRLEARLVAGDLNGSWAVVEAALNSGKEPTEIYLEVIGPALVSIGGRWEMGELGVHDEHIATAVANRIIGRLSGRFCRRGRNRGGVITTMAPGERHDLGVAMLADIIRGRGFEVLDLGADTPVDSLPAAMSRLEDLVAVCIGSVVTGNLERVTEMVCAARRCGGPRVAIVLGGRGIGSTRIARELGADAYAADALQAADRLEEFAARRPTT